MTPGNWDEGIPAILEMHRLKWVIIYLRLMLMGKLLKLQSEKTTLVFGLIIALSNAGEIMNLDS